MPDPRLLSSETAYSGRLFTVSLDTIEMESGVIAHRETIRHVANLDRATMIDVMSSSYRGLRTRERERMATLDSMNVTLSRDVLVFELRGSGSRGDAKKAERAE
jgi:hypothetical protein